MALVFKTPKTAINTTTRDIQNLSADCPPCPEVELTTAEVEYTENGSFTVTPESGFDGLSQVDITVNIDTQSIADEAYAEGEAAGIVTGKAQGVAEQKAKLTSTTITQNGTSTREDGWNSVTVNVQPTLQSKTINPATVIQGVQADAGYDGLSNVTVNAVTSAIDANIRPENILEGITILGVEGTDQGYDVGYQAGQEQCGGYQSAWALDETITENSTYTFDPSDYSDPEGANYDCFDYVQITVNVPTDDCPDWSSIGWTCDNVTASGLADDVAYAASVADQSTWAYDDKLTFVPIQSTEGHNGGLFNSCTSLKYCGGYLELTAEDASFNDLFSGCSNLKSVGDITAPNASGTTFANNMFGGCSNLESVGMIDGSHIERASYMFNGCTKLTSIYSIDNTEHLTGTYGMFNRCSSLTSVPLFDTSKVTTMYGMFAYSGITTIPQFDTSNLTVAHLMFAGCYNLTTIPQLDFSKVNGVSDIFYICESLTNLSGFTNLGKAFTGTNNTLDLSPSTVLTKESIMNVINNLAAPDDTTVTNATLKLSATSYALLDASEIAIATAKNWTVVSA